MKNIIITYIKLMNVAGIYRGLNGKESIEIHFPTNTIYNLITGANGSGKSTFINSIDIFFNEAIRKGRKGYKELGINYGNKQYIIKHFANPSKDSHTVKSFITEIDEFGNATELNENGNVTSFKEQIKILFGLDQSSTKLLKLGSEINSMVKMSPTERKKFTSTFTEEVDIFFKMYKKINSDYIFLNKLLNSYLDKLNILGNENDLIKQLEDINNTISILNKNKEDAITNIKIIDNELIDLSEYEKNKNKLSILKDNITYSSEYDDLKKIIPDLDLKDITKLQYELEKYEYKLSSNNTLINQMYKIQLDNITNKISDIKDNIYELDLKLDSIDASNLNEEIIKELNDINGYLKENEEAFNKVPECLKTIEDSDLLQLKELLNAYENNLSDISNYVFNDDLENFDINTDYNNLNINILTGINKLNSDLESLNNDYKVFNELFKDGLPCDNYNCVLLKQYTNNNKSKEDIINNINKIQEELVNSEKIQLRINNLNTIKELTKKILIQINTYDKFILNKLKINEEVIISNIRNNKFNILDDLLLQDLLDTLYFYKEYKNKLEIKIKLSSMELDLKEKNRIENEISKYNNEIAKLENEYNSYKINIDNILEENDKIKKDIELTQKTIRVKNSYDNIKNIKSEINNLQDIINKQDKNIIIKNNNKIELEKINNDLSILNNKRDSLLYTITEIKNVKEKIEFHKNYFNELSILRKALSPNKGIPLKYIQSFMNGVRTTANELIEEVFNDKISLGEFVINENEFRIPVNGEDDSNDDIRTCSSGERAIISLALSFALVKQTNTKYKILLLDEIDGPLDKVKRRQFLYLLNTQIKKLGIKQVFIISHNDVFNDLDINLILFTGAEIENFTNKNILYKY